MRKLILIAALLLTSAAAAQIINEGAAFVSGGGGGSGGPVALIKQTEQREGSTFTVVGKSTLDFSHRLAVQYRYVAGAYALHLGQSDVALTYTDYFADAGTSHNESKLIATPGLYDGDSLYVRVVVAALDSSVVLDTLERGYLIDHDIVTLAMGNAYGAAAIFNPTGMVPTTSVTLTTANYKTAFLRSGAGYEDSCYAAARTNNPISVATGGPVFSTVPRHTGLWYDLSGIPDDATIVEAKLSLRCSYSAGLAFAEGDGIYAILDTLSADVPWTQGPVGTCNTNDPNQTSAQWIKMGRTIGTDWTPTMTARTATYQFGIQSPLTRQFGPADYTISTGDTIQIDVTEVLQYWSTFRSVRDIQQAGFWLLGKRAAGSGSFEIYHGTYGSFENAAPSLVVRYQPKPYTGYVWNGYPFVFVTTVDDGHNDNSYYRTVFDERGLKYTMFVNGEYVGDPNYLTGPQIKEYFDAGYEIGNHGERHNLFSVVNEDSIGFVIGRDWLATILGLSGADTMQIRSYAYANGDTADAGGGASSVIDKLNEYGYTGARTAFDILTASPNPMQWDVASEIFKLGKVHWDDIADTGDDAAAIRLKLITVIGRYATRANILTNKATVGTQPIVMITHGRSEIGTAQMGYILDEMERRGDVWVTTYGEMMEWYRDHHTSVGGKVWTLP